MKKFTSLVIMFAMLTISIFTITQTASAETTTIIGALTKIEMAADGKSATTVLKDVKSGDSVTIIVTDDQTLDKFKDKRIVEGDEIRSKFENQDGKNRSKIFKKTAGC